MELGRFDLNAAQLDILIYLRHHPEAEQRDLQAALGVTSATLTRVLDHMVNRGFAERRPSLSDSRVKRVVATEKGLSLLVTLQKQESQQFYDRVFRGFTREEVQLLTRLLQRLADNMGDTSQNIF